MSAFRLRVDVLGRSLLDVQVGEPPAPVVEPPAPVVEATGNNPGPVTERRAAPVLGFAPSRPAQRRAASNDPPVVR